MFVQLCIVLVLLYLVFKSLRKDGPKLPPGPFQWPLIGNLTQLAAAHPDFPHIAMNNLAQKYGDIMSIKFGVHKCVVLNSYEGIKDLFGKEEFSGRYDFPFAADRSFHKVIGVIFASGNEQRDLRRYTIRTLRDFGFGKRNSMSSVLTDELLELNSILDSHLKADNQLLTIEPDLFALSFVNIIWSFAAGFRFSHNDPQPKRILKLNDDVIRSWNFNNPSVPFPILRYIFPTWTNYSYQMGVFTELNDFLRGLIRQLKKSYDDEAHGVPRSFVECFIQEMESKTGKEDPIFTEEQLITVLNDLFLGGGETTSNTLTYALLYMVLNPDVQKKVQDEISKVSSDGNDQILELSDLAKMPYTEACIQEIFRCSHLVPLPIPRKTTADYIYKGYFIPEGTCVFFNLAAVMTDKTYWGDPDTFRPERFLNSAGNKVINQERVIPFGYGKRVCLAESLARESFFIYFTTLLKKYKFELPVGCEKPSAEPLVNFTLRPAAFKAKVRLRNNA